MKGKWQIRSDDMQTGKNVWLNIKYALLQMMFWTAAASGYAFLTQMLQYKGFDEAQIGVINAVKLFSTVIFQVIIGSFSDKHAKERPLKYIIAFLAGIACILTVIFYGASLSYGFTIILFIGFGATFTCISPMIDALSLLYINNGVHVNYVAGRAAGSAAWAVACVLFGICADRFGVDKLILLQFVFTAGILLVAVVMNKININDGKSAGKQEKVSSALFLIKRYRKYRWFLIGSAVMFMGYNVGTTFLINVFEGLGGNNTHYGIAEFVMAISEVPSAFIFMKFRKKISLDKMMLCCAFFMTLKNVFAAFSGSVSVIIISQSCEMLGFGLFYAGSVFMVEELLSPVDVVKGMSLINAATVGVGEGVGALVCGYINSRFGLAFLMRCSVLISVISILCMMVMCRISKNMERDLT